MNTNVKMLIHAGISLGGLVLIGIGSYKMYKFSKSEDKDQTAFQNATIMAVGGVALLTVGNAAANLLIGPPKQA